MAVEAVVVLNDATAYAHRTTGAMTVATTHTQTSHTVAEARGGTNAGATRRVVRTAVMPQVQAPTTASLKAGGTIAVRSADRKS